MRETFATDSGSVGASSQVGGGSILAVFNGGDVLQVCFFTRLRSVHLCPISTSAFNLQTIISSSFWNSSVQDSGNGGDKNGYVSISSGSCGGGALATIISSQGNVEQVEQFCFCTPSRPRELANCNGVRRTSHGPLLPTMSLQKFQMVEIKT